MQVGGEANGRKEEQREGETRSFEVTETERERVGGGENYCDFGLYKVAMM